MSNVLLCFIHVSCYDDLSCTYVLVMHLSISILKISSIHELMIQVEKELLVVVGYLLVKALQRIPLI